MAAIIESSIPYHLYGVAQLTAEFRLVAACSWLPGAIYSARQGSVVGSLLETGLNWDEVVPLVVRNGIAGQFCKIMGQRDWINVPAEAKDRLKRIRAQQTVRSLGQVAELTRIATLFASAEIAFMPLKGVTLSQELYGDPCMRSSCDLDILARPESLEAIFRILEQNGYTCCLHGTPLTERQKRYIRNNLYHLEFINSDLGLTIELHWRLGSQWQPEHSELVWSNAHVCNLNGVEFACLDSCMQLLFLADHGARHRFCCLKWLADIAQIVASFPAEDWGRLIWLADRLDLKLTLAHTALLVHWVYEIPLPGQLLELVRIEKRAVGTSTKVIELLRLGASSPVSYSKRLGSMAFAWQILRLRRSQPLFRTLKPSLIAAADFHDFPLPDSFFWLYYPLRPFSWLWRYYTRPC